MLRASGDETKVILEIGKGTDLFNLERCDIYKPKKLMWGEARIILIPKSVGSTRSSIETKWAGCSTAMNGSRMNPLTGVFAKSPWV